MGRLTNIKKTTEKDYARPCEQIDAYVTFIPRFRININVNLRLVRDVIHLKDNPVHSTVFIFKSKSVSTMASIVGINFSV